MGYRGASFIASFICGVPACTGPVHYCSATRRTQARTPLARAATSPNQFPLDGDLIPASSCHCLCVSLYVHCILIELMVQTAGAAAPKRGHLLGSPRLGAAALPYQVYGDHHLAGPLSNDGRFMVTGC